MEAGENSEMICKSGRMDVELKDGMVHDSTVDQDDDGRKDELEDERGDAKTEEAAEESQKKGDELIYSVDSIPPWYITFLYAFQQVISCLASPVTASFVISACVCGQDDHTFLAELMGISVFMSGLCTFIQVTFGIRIPVMQGSSLHYLPFIISMMSTPQWKCPPPLLPPMADQDSNGSNATTSSSYVEQLQQLWRPRMMEASGALIVASTIEVILGVTGVVGLLTRFIGPLTITPTLALGGLSLSSAVSRSSKHHWGVSLSTAAVFLVVSQFLRHIQVPIPVFSKKQRFHFKRLPLFRLFPHVVAIAYGWILCFILTATDHLPSNPGEAGYKARTDTKTSFISDSNWFLIPYPGMWGRPTLSAGIFVGMLSATISSIIDSIGDYYATARVCRVATPPKHAMNRGIAAEGLGSIICGLLGAAHATSSLSGPIGIIPLTGMGSRLTWQVAGVLTMVAGIFGKFGAALASIPEPVLGGIMIVVFGMVVAVGLSNLQFVDLESSRNLTILGVSFMLGMMIPEWMKKNQDAIRTGNAEVDQTLTILLGTPMFIGGCLGCLLDNIIRGTKIERGMTEFQPMEDGNENFDYKDPKFRIYNPPWTDRLSSYKCRVYSFIPIFPCYVSRSLKNFFPINLIRKRNKSQESEPIKTVDI